MYLPRNYFTRNLPHKNGSKGKKGMLGIMCALLLLGATVCLTLWQAAKDLGESDSASLLRHDLTQLWKWSDNVYKHGSAAADWSIRWDMTTTRIGSLEALSGSLFVDERQHALPKLVTNEGRTISGTWPDHSANLSISLTNHSNDGEEVMMLLELPGHEFRSLDELLETTALISSTLSEFTPAFTSTIKVQGTAEGNRAIDRLIRLSLAERIEKYEDEGTVSEFVHTAQLKANWSAGKGRQGNMQISLHRSTEHNDMDLTIGIPAISGDF